MNQCDHGHEIEHEVRLLPTGDSGNIILCAYHWAKELQWRRMRNKELEKRNHFELPGWFSLKLYDPS